MPAVFGLVLVVLSCSPSGATAPATAPAAAATAATLSAPAATSAATAKPIRKLTYGSPVTPPNLVHMGTYVAQELGYFKDVGLEVEFKSFEGGVGALRGLIAGGLDVVGTSSDPLLVAVAQGGGIHAIGAYAPKLSVVMMGSPDVKTPADLKGKKMGIQDVNGFADVMNQLLLASVGLKRDDVQSINVTTAGRVPALVSGQINAHALHSDQYYAALKQKSDLVVLAKMWEVAPKWWYSAFVAADDRVKKEPELFVDFMTALLKAQRWMYDPKNKAKVVEIALKYNPGLGADAFDKAWDDLSKGGIWTVNDGMPKDFIQYTIDKKIELGTQGVPKDLKYEQIVDISVVNEAIKRLGGPMTGDQRWY
jgi:ABC-type nitrate/sulfonate/bicarbonate transport system substrate-binding protein